MLTHSVARRLASHPMRWRCASVVASASAGRAASGERILHPVPYQAQTSAVSADDGSRLGFAASYSSTPAPPRGELVRDYIHDSLYHPTEGYFTSRPVSVGVLSERLNFHRFQGQSEYTRRIGQLYVELSASWLTPVEIFRPWYAQALARYMLRQHQERCFAQGDATIPLLVYEIGGGSGTCARDVLDYIHSKAPAVHRTMRYTTVEISAALAAKQQLCVTEQGLHTDQFTVCAGLDAGKVESWGGVDERPCYVIMLEVLDNLPHDRVCNTSDGWMQTRVVPSNHTVGEGDSWAREESREELEPLTDPLIQRCLAAVHPNVQTRPSLLARAQNALAGLLGSRFAHTEFLPTASLALFDVLHTVRPAHRLIAADFDELPDVMVAGTTAPLVASKRDGKTQDHSTYIVPRGEADIFFPTDFDAVERIYRASREACTGVPAPPDSTKVLTTRSFFQRYGETWQTQTADGYNPMLEDFTNTRVLLSTAGPQDNRVSDIFHDLMLHHSARWLSILFDLGIAADHVGKPSAGYVVLSR